MGFSPLRRQQTAGPARYGGDQMAHLRVLPLDVGRETVMAERLAADRPDRSDDRPRQGGAQLFFQPLFGGDLEQVVALRRVGEERDVDSARGDLARGSAEPRRVLP